MGTFLKKLLESLEDVSGVIEKFDAVIIKLRDNKVFDKHPEIAKSLFNFYNNIVVPFQEKYILLATEKSDSKVEEEIINEILDFYNILKEILPVEVSEKKLTKAEKAKQEDIVKAIAKEKGGKKKLEPKDYAIATAQAKKSAE